jgi:triacylglycerol lipase
MNPGTAVMLAHYANEAYYAYYADDYFVNGYPGLDGTYRQYVSQSAWLSANHYTAIEDRTTTARDARYFGIVATKSDVVIVAFRGTDNHGDLLLDIWDGALGPNLDGVIPFKKWTAGTSTILVNKNFLGKYLNLSPSVRDTVKGLFSADRTLTKLYVTGHSLGGALATICALDIVTTMRRDVSRVPVPEVYTFGSPTVGDAAFATAVNAAVPNHFRIYDQQDWIPTVPAHGTNPDWTPGAAVPVMFNYQHAGTGTGVRSGNRLLNAHLLGSYYGACRLLEQSSHAQPGATAMITSLRLRITTDNRLGAGIGDNDVFLTVFGNKLGPLNKSATDYQPGTTTDREFTTSDLPYGKHLSDLTNLTLTLKARDGLSAPTDAFWRPTSLELFVNDTSQGNWPLSRVLSGYEPILTVPIH